MVANGFLFRGGTAKRFLSSKTQHVAATHFQYLFISNFSQAIISQWVTTRQIDAKQKTFFILMLSVYLSSSFYRPQDNEQFHLKIIPIY